MNTAHEKVMTASRVNTGGADRPIAAFAFICRNCGSDKVTLDLDAQSYPSCSWVHLDIRCRECGQVESLHSA